MKLKILAIFAIAFSSNSYAVSPNTPANIEIFISGSDSYDERIGYFLEQNLCKEDFDTFLDSKSMQLGLNGFSWYGEAGENYRSWSCIVDEEKVSGADPGDVLLIHKNSTGESGFGVFSVVHQNEIERIDLQNAYCEEVSAGEWKCTQITVNDTPLLGVSDIEPAVFKGPNRVTAFGDIKDNDLDKLTINTQSQQVSGVIVTTELRNTLQLAQGLVVGEEDEANMPSLSTNLVRSLFTGQVNSWFDVVDPSGTDLFTLASENIPVSDTVGLCVRKPGSSARAQFTISFLKTYCSDISVYPYMIEGEEWPLLQSNSDSDEMDDCVADIGGDGELQWAIGYQSTEKNMDLSRNYRFIKIDGAAPTLQNVANDKYQYWFEQTIQYNKQEYMLADIAAQKVIDLIIEEAGQPSIISGLNAKYEHPWGQGGYMSKPTDRFGVQPPAFPFDTSYPVNRTTRSPAGFSIDSCRLPVHVNGAWPGAVGF